MTVNELSPGKLRLECPPDQVGCETSAELGPVDGIIGQDRALKALKFGVEMKGKGFNVYVAGPPITGKRPAARSFLENIAKTRPVPPDWVYVNNFQNPYEPKTLKLPPGRAKVFQKDVNDLDARTLEELKKLRDDSVRYAIGGLMTNLVSRYEGLPNVVQHLNELRDDIMENTELFTPGGTEEKPDSEEKNPLEKSLPDFLFRRYDVNVIVDNSELKGAPVISEDNPTVTNLLGKFENESRFGALTTDFTLIKGGSLHRANGGYLILGAIELLKNQFSYDGLKRVLQSGSILIEETGQRLGVASTKTLVPQSIPLNVKVILVGDHEIYQALYTQDPDFGILFKVKAHFDDSIERNDQNQKTYGSFVHSLCEREGLNHLEAPALAKVVEYGSRLAEDQTKLSTKFPEIADLVREANFYATQDGAKIVKDVHIKKALDEKVYRSNLLDEKIKEMIERGIILIDTSGTQVGQVNGLSVISLGDFDFGQPSRITASLGLGRRGIIDIERESRMGGQTHTKGVLIISGYIEH